MKLETYTCEFITPAFCAGATQAEAEIRATEVRGQLRWWFRCLAPERAAELEREVFGSAAGAEGNGSALQIRTRIIKRGQAWEPPRIDPMSDNAYVYYFASVSGKASGQQGTGPRWTEQGNLPPGTQFELQIRHLRPISAEAEKVWQDALSAFLIVGGLGLRVTRGLGSFVCLQRPPDTAALDACKSLLETRRFHWVVTSKDLPSWTKAIDAAGNVLRRQLRPKFLAGKQGNQTSPLGSSSPRQTSAVYLRPVRHPDNTFSLVVFEAPSERVLGPASRRGAPATNILR